MPRWSRLRREQHEFPVAFRALEESEVTLLVEHDEIDQAIVIPIDGIRRGSPLGEQGFALGFLPAPRQLWRRAFPFHFDRLRGGLGFRKRRGL